MVWRADGGDPVYWVCIDGWILMYIHTYIHTHYRHQHQLQELGKGVKWRKKGPSGRVTIQHHLLHFICTHVQHSIYNMHCTIPIWWRRPKRPGALASALYTKPAESPPYDDSYSTHPHATARKVPRHPVAAIAAAGCLPAARWYGERLAGGVPIGARGSGGCSAGCGMLW